MTRRWTVAVLAGALLTTGCTVGIERPPDALPSSSRPVLPGLPTNASTGLPEYTGAPADAPASLGPLTRLRAAVDLTPATSRFARSVAVAPAEGGGAHVVMNPIDAELPQQLVRIGPDLAVAGAVPIPPVVDVWSVHELDDGRVAVVGLLSAEQGYGVALVDPASGAATTTVVAPFAAGTVAGGSALTGATLYQFISRGTADGASEQLVAVDLGTGSVLARRNLGDDVAAASLAPIGKQLAAVLPRPDGGVVLAFDASPTEVLEDRIPTLLTYDAQLELVGDPVRVTDLAEGAEIQAVAGSPDGTVFLLVEVREGGWILAVPDSGGAGPVLAQLADRVYDYALSVEPAQQWALLPTPDGAQAVDLGTGELGGTLSLGCEPRLDVRDIVSTTDGALLIGECDTPREDTQMVWFAGP
jgi:hypothetical protein